MPDVLPNIPQEPAQGIQALLDTVYLWNPDVANGLIDKVNELLEKLGDLTNLGAIKPYSELVAPVPQYLPMSYNNAVYVANEELSELPATPDLTKWTQIATKVDQSAIETQIQAEEDARIAEDAILQGNIDSEAGARAQADTALGNRITAEETARSGADSNLQQQIDAITASSDVKDIVGTHAELEDYDTSTLGDNDIIKVLQDETQQDATTYYRWDEAEDQFQLIGEEGPYYTKAQSDSMLAEKQNTLTAGPGITIENDVISSTATGDFVPQYDTMPTASASDVGELAQYSGESVADSYQKGYFYINQPTYTDPSATISQTAGQTDSISFETTVGNTEISGTTEAVRAWFSANGWTPTTNDTLTFECVDASNQTWRCQCGSIPGYNSVSLQDWYEQFGFVFTGEPQVNDAVVCTYTLSNLSDLSVNVDTFVEAEQPTQSGNTNFVASVTEDTADFTTTQGATTFSTDVPSVVLFQINNHFGYIPFGGLGFFSWSQERGAWNFENEDHTQSVGFFTTQEIENFGIAVSRVPEDGDTIHFNIHYAASTWSKNGTAVDLADYGISYSGAPVDGDTLTVAYTAPVIAGYAWSQINVQPAEESGNIEWKTKVDLPAEYTGDPWSAKPYYTVVGGIPDGVYEFYFATKVNRGESYPDGEVIYKVRFTKNSQNNTARGIMGYVFNGDYTNSDNKVYGGENRWWYSWLAYNEADLILYGDLFVSEILNYNGHQAVPECFKLSAIKNVDTGQEYIAVGAINLNGDAPVYTLTYDSNVVLAGLVNPPFVPQATAWTTLTTAEFATKTVCINKRIMDGSLHLVTDGSELIVNVAGTGGSAIAPYSQEIVRATGIFSGSYLAYGSEYIYVMGVDTTTAATLSGTVSCGWGGTSNDNMGIWFDLIPTQSLTTLAQFGPQAYRLGTITSDGIGNIVQYTGATDSNYTNGYYYKANGTLVPVPASITFTNFNPSDVTVTVANPDALITAINNIGGWGEQWVRDVFMQNQTSFNVEYDFGTGTVIKVWWSNYGDMYQQDVLDCFAVSTTGSYSEVLTIGFDCNNGYTPGHNDVTNTSWDRIDVQPGGGTTITIITED